MTEVNNHKKFPRPKEPGETWALVLGGGGAKGCYHVGAWQAFNEQKITFDAISGTSIGALVGIFYPGNHIREVTSFVMEMTPETIAKDLPALPGSVKQTVQSTREVLDFIKKYFDSKMDITPLRTKFEEMFCYEDFASSPIKYACMTFNDTKKEPRPFFKEEITKENAEDIVMASAACYPAFPKVEMDGQEYIDGGYADNVPIKLVEQIAPDASQIVVIDLHDPFEPEPKDLSKDMFYIQPILHPGNSLDFTTSHAERLYCQGYLETRKYLGLNPGYVFTFRSEDAPLMQIVERYLDAQLEQMDITLPKEKGIGLQALGQLLGYTPRPLDNPLNGEYKAGQLVEALGLLAHMDPVALYDYKTFLQTAISRLAQMKITETSQEDYKVVEVFSNLKRDELPVIVHQFLSRNNGTLPAPLESLKEGMPVSYALAYVWYFMEKLVENLDEGQSAEQPQKPQIQDDSSQSVKDEAAQKLREWKDEFSSMYEKIKTSQALHKALSKVKKTEDQFVEAKRPGQ